LGEEKAIYQKIHGREETEVTQMRWGRGWGGWKVVVQEEDVGWRSKLRMVRGRRKSEGEGL
jgi:hypothetical protein